jgi:AcrR family transcriptional regulator
MTEAFSMSDDARKLRRKHEPEDKVARLIRATVETIATEGYPRATVQEICRRANVSVGTFYEHFDNKADLLKQHATLDSMLRLSPEELGNLEQLEKKAAEFLFGDAGMLWRGWREAVMAEPSLQPLDQEYAASIRNMIRDSVRETRARSGLSTDDAVVDGVAWSIHALIREAVRRAGRQPEHIERVFARAVWLLVHDAR